MRPVVLCCVLAACVGPLDDDTGAPLTSTESAIWDGGGDDPDGEVIVIEGEVDACWDAGLCWIGVGHEDPVDPGDTGDGYGGGGGGAGGGKKPKPAPRNCAAEKEEYGKEMCRDCCAWNHDKIDAPACGKLKTNLAKALCYEAAIAKEGACSAMCSQPDPGIPTAGAQ